MAAAYQIATAADKRRLSEFLVREGQLLLPMVRLIEQAELAIDEMIDVLGRASIEAVAGAFDAGAGGSQVAGESVGRRSPARASAGRDPPEALDA